MRVSATQHMGRSRTHADRVCAINPGVHNFITPYDPRGRTVSLHDEHRLMARLQSVADALRSDITREKHRATSEHAPMAHDRPKKRSREKLQEARADVAARRILHAPTPATALLPGAENCGVSRVFVVVVVVVALLTDPRVRAGALFGLPVAEEQDGHCHREHAADHRNEHRDPDPRHAELLHGRREAVWRVRARLCDTLDGLEVRHVRLRVRDLLRRVGERDPVDELVDHVGSDVRDVVRHHVSAVRDDEIREVAALLRESGGRLPPARRPRVLGRRLVLARAVPVEMEQQLLCPKVVAHHVPLAVVEQHTHAAAQHRLHIRERAHAVKVCERLVDRVAADLEAERALFVRVQRLPDARLIQVLDDPVLLLRVRPHRVDVLAHVVVVERHAVRAPDALEDRVHVGKALRRVELACEQRVRALAVRGLERPHLPEREQPHAVRVLAVLVLDRRVHPAVADPDAAHAYRDVGVLERHLVLRENVRRELRDIAPGVRLAEEEDLARDLLVAARVHRQVLHVAQQELAQEVVKVTGDLLLGRAETVPARRRHARAHGLVDEEQVRAVVPAVLVDLDGGRSECHVQEHPLHAGAARAAVEPNDERRALWCRGRREVPVEDTIALATAQRNVPRVVCQIHARVEAREFTHEIVDRRCGGGAQVAGELLAAISVSVRLRDANLGMALPTRDQALRGATPSSSSSLLVCSVIGVWEEVCRTHRLTCEKWKKRLHGDVWIRSNDRTLSYPLSTVMLKWRWLHSCCLLSCPLASGRATLLSLRAPPHLFLLLDDLAVESVAVVGGRVLGIVIHDNLESPWRARLVLLIVKLRHVRMLERVVARDALAWVELAGSTGRTKQSIPQKLRSTPWNSLQTQQHTYPETLADEVECLG
ncbi:hypothetical protein PybrP1_002604 [[Pythium] brassicae (nom. inval.)]|nr:hypothetical protein PybrP1_002604 [[Pythium] brassicae (nom. inval.)]